MILFGCCIFLAFLFILPFGPGIRVLRSKIDAEPLFVNMDYCKDPRYFALSFKKILSEQLNTGYKEGLYQFRLSKHEMVQVADNIAVTDAKDLAFGHIFYVKNHFASAAGSVFEKEIYVRGTANLGENTSLRALACDGNVHVQRGAVIIRWLDAEGDITVDEDCRLGISATCGKTLSLARNCSFKRLYGLPVVTSGLPFTDSGEREQSYEETAESEAAATLQKSAYAWPFEGIPAPEGVIERDISQVPPNTRKDCSIITAHSLMVGDYSLIRGHVKTGGSLTLGTGVMIAGNLFADGDIHIGRDSRISGVVFTNGNIVCEDGVTIGSPGRTMSLIGQKSITLRGKTIVYGYIMTEGRGSVI